ANSEEAFAGGLTLAAQSRAALLVNIIDHAIDKTRSIATRPTIIRVNRELTARPGDAAGREFLRKVAESELDDARSALEFRDARGAPLVTAGSFWPDSTWLFTLKRSHGARIYWDQGFALRIEVPVMDGSVQLGSVVAQLALPAIANEVLDVSSFGDT